MRVGEETVRGRKGPKHIVYVYEIVKVFFKTNNNPLKGKEVRREHGRTCKVQEKGGYGCGRG